MHYIATAHAYDVMGCVQITAEVRSVSDTEGRPTSSVLHATTTISGVGETDARLWLTDVLVGLLEDL